MAKVTTVQKVEVKSSVNDNTVIAFKHEDEGVNYITAGYNRICEMFGIDNFTARNRYYITK